MHKKLAVICLVLACVAILPGICHAQAKTDTAAANGLVKGFEAHWATAKALAVAVADAMPADQYGFKPNPEEMTFGEQIVHIAGANYNYCSVIGGTKSPYTRPAKGTQVEKAAAIKALGESFDYCTKIFDGLTDAQLMTEHGEGENKISNGDLMLGVMIHMAHHRGQVEVYLRLKGITPPEYNF
jgi:uncharacterized damage-inducible protein DinB